MKPGDRVRYRDRDITRRAVILAIGEKRITVSFYRYGRPCVSKVRPYTVTPWVTASRFSHTSSRFERCGRSSNNRRGCRCGAPYPLAARLGLRHDLNRPKWFSDCGWPILAKADDAKAEGRIFNGARRPAVARRTVAGWETNDERSSEHGENRTDHGEGARALREDSLGGRKRVCCDRPRNRGRRATESSARMVHVSIRRSGAGGFAGSAIVESNRIGDGRVRSI